MQDQSNDILAGLDEAELYNEEIWLCDGEPICFQHTLYDLKHSYSYWADSRKINFEDVINAIRNDLIYINKYRCSDYDTKVCIGRNEEKTIDAFNHSI